MQKIDIAKDKLENNVLADCCNQRISHQLASGSIALVGNPNCGKTTLFNALTGALQRVGNWPGVTVERKSGYFKQQQTTVEVVDLPGLYALTQVSAAAAIDERIANDYILSRQATIIVNIVDASCLERHLYLTMQLIEMGVPIILALNRMDVARHQKIKIDLNALSQTLGCTVIALEANRGSGINALKTAIIDHLMARTLPSSLNTNPYDYPAPIEAAIAALAPTTDRWLAIRLLEGDVYARSLAAAIALEQVPHLQQQIQQALQEETDILIAETRYQRAQQIVKHCLSVAAMPSTTWTMRFDAIVLNRWLGIPIFLAVMYSMFFFAINIGGAFQDFFDISSQTIFVDALGFGLTKLGAPAWIAALFAGIGKGINTTVTFIPVIGSMFLFLAFLEDSGYMARAAFVVDRFMRMLGLPGKAFVPMIVGFGCNVPAVMGARTLDCHYDRVLTIMMSPFMSCGARLAIYAVFTAAFFPHGAQNVVFALYMIGILMAIFTGYLLRRTLLQGEAAPLVMEIPAYHLPNSKTLCLHAWQRLKGFVYRAGCLIVPISVLIGALNILNIDGTLNTEEGDVRSILSLVGQWITPVFAPMGIQADNWPATVGLVTGILAKEVVIGTLNALYTQVGQLAAVNTQSAFDLWAGLSSAWSSIPQNLGQLSDAFTNPILAQAPLSTVNQGVYGLMYQRFDGQIGAFAYLLFVLLYFPCISTMAAMLRELHRGWAIFSACWMTGIAYGAAVTFYQAATWARHPLYSLLWILTLFTLFIGTIVAIRWIAMHRLSPITTGEYA